MNKKTIFTLALLVITSLALAGCSGELSSISITPDYYKLEVGNSLTLNLVAKDGFGNEVVELPEVDWKVEGNGAQLSKQNGLETVLTVNELGTVTVIATAGEFTAEAKVEVLSEIPEPLLIHDSFESESVGSFPANWTVKNADVHESAGSGPRVAKVTGTPDGTQSFKYENLPRADGVPMSEASLDLPYVARGRLEFSAFQPQGESSNFGIKPYYDNDRLVNFWLSTGGDLRLDEMDAQRIGNNTWESYAIEWDVDAGWIKVFHLENNNWVEKSPRGGYSLSVAPNRLAIDGGTVEGRAAWGALDNVKLIDLDLVW